MLHELAFSARKMGNTRLAVKLLSGLLHNTHQYLNKSEQVEMLMALENYSKALIVKSTEHDESLREAATLPLFCDINFQGNFHKQIRVLDKVLKTRDKYIINFVYLNCL